MPAIIRWGFSEGEKNYEFGQTDLGVGELRQFKEWFGKEYGSVDSFVRLVDEGDVDAMVCVRWAALKRAGENPPDPRNAMAFSVGDMFYDLRKLHVEEQLAELAKLAEEQETADPPTGAKTPD